MTFTEVSDTNYRIPCELRTSEVDTCIKTIKIGYGLITCDCDPVEGNRFTMLSS